MKRLFKAIWHLGFRLGWRYWRIENRCIENPELVRKWAHDCRCMAARCCNGSIDDAAEWSILLDWADRLEESYAAYMKPRNKVAEAGEQLRPFVKAVRDIDKRSKEL